MNKIFLILGTVICLLAIVMGAFGAHMIENQFGERSSEIFDTAATYQMYHGLAILITCLMSTTLNSKLFKIAMYFFIVGTICFSGSLYLLAFKTIIGPAIHYIGPITPIGGLLYIIGWILFIVGILKSKPTT